MTDFGDFCRKLKLDDREAEKLFPGFAESSRLFAAESQQEELTDAYLDRILPWVDLPEADAAALRAFAARVRNDPAAAQLFFHAKRTLFFGAELKAICEWPDLEAFFGDEHPLFYLLLSCAVFAPAGNSFRTAGLPEANLRLIGRKINASNWINKAAFGVPGYDRHALYWLKHYVTLAVIPVGRFEFRRGVAQTYGVEVFRRRSDGAVLARAGGGGCRYGFRADGSACPPEATDAVSVGALIKTPDFVIGHALDAATGKALGVVKLPLTEWAPVVTAQTPVLEWHIPGGGGMTPEVTRKSLAEGLEFFDRHFPALPAPAAVMCSSWAFWRRYEELRPQANPALVMRECYEFGRPVRGFNGFYFIFGANSPAELPGEPRRDTSIRRTMLDVLEREGALSVGGVFILREDLDKWGSSPYRDALRCRDWQRYLITAAKER